MTAVPAPAPAPEGGVPDGGSGSGVLRVLLRAMDAPPAGTACARALLSPDRRLAAEQAAADAHLFRFRALLDSHHDALLPALDTRVPGATPPAYAWGRPSCNSSSSSSSSSSTSSSGSSNGSSNSYSAVCTATFLAATEAGAVVVRWRASREARSDADARAPHVLRVPPLESAVFAVPWAAQERAVAPADPVPHAFVYEVRGGLRGLLVPPRVRVHRVLGVYAAALPPLAGTSGSSGSSGSSSSDGVAYFTCVTQVRSADGRAACAVSVLAADDDALKLLRYFELVPGSGAEGDDDEDGDGVPVDEDDEERPLPPPPAVTCVDWACFVLTGHTVHIVDCRTGTRLGCVDCAPPSSQQHEQQEKQEEEEEALDVVAVSSDLRLLAVAAAARPVCRVVDLARYFRATPRARWLRPGLAFARHIELVPSTLDDDDGAAALGADAAAAAPRTEVADSDDALEWPDYVRTHLDRAPERDGAAAADEAYTHDDLVAWAAALPAVRDGFSAAVAPAMSQRQEQQQKCDWMVCLAPPSADAPETTAATTSTTKTKTRHLALMVAGDALAWFRTDAQDDADAATTGEESAEGGLLREVWMYSQLRGWAPAVERFDAAHPPVLVAGDGFWYVVCGAACARPPGVVALLAGQDEQQVINSLIMFELTDVADALCEQNAWDRRARCLNTLALGLRYKQLDVVEHALASLEDDQQARGLALVLAHVRAVVDIPAEEDTSARLVQLATRYIVAHALPAAIAREAAAGADGAAGAAGAAGEGESDDSDGDDGDDDDESEEEEEEEESDGTHGSAADGELATVAQLSRLLESLRRLATKLLHAETPRQLEDERRRRRHHRRKQKQQAAGGEKTTAAAADDKKDGKGDSDKSDKEEERGCPSVEAICAGLRPEELFEQGDLARWGRLADVEIVREALLSNRLPSAVSYLRCTRAAGGRWPLRALRLAAAELAYQACCDGNFFQAAVFLDNAGLRAPAALGELLHSTARRQLRHGLESFLQLETRYLPAPAAARTAAVLESLFQAPSFFAEYEQQKRTAHTRRFATQPCDPPRMLPPPSSSSSPSDSASDGASDGAGTIQLDQCSEVDDLTPRVCARYGFELVYPSQQAVGAAAAAAGEAAAAAIPVVAEVEALGAPTAPAGARVRSLSTSSSGGGAGAGALPPRAQRSATGGYIRFSLRWLAQWPAATLERVLVERDHELGARDPRQLVAYALAHNAHALAAFWLDRVLAHRLQSGGEGGAAGSSNPAAVARACGLDAATLALATPAHRERMRRALARLGCVDVSTADGGNEAEKEDDENEDSEWMRVARVAQGGALFDAPAGTPGAAPAFHAAVCALLGAGACTPALAEYVYARPDRAAALLAASSASAPSWSALCARLAAGPPTPAALAAAAVLNARLLLLPGLHDGGGSSSDDDEKSAVLEALGTHAAPAGHALLGVVLAALVGADGALGRAAALVPGLAAQHPALAHALAARTQPRALFCGAGDAADLYAARGDASLAGLLRAPELPVRARALYAAGRTPGAGSTLAGTDLARTAGAAARVGVAHYVAHGSPFVAAALAPRLVACSSRGDGSRADAVAAAVREQAWECCRRRPGDVRLVMACACVVELLGADSLRLRVDSAALAVLRTAAADSGEACGALVDAAWRGGAAEAARVAAALKECAGAAGGRRARRLGSLTALYCRVHGLPLPVAVLAAFAERGDWAAFLLSATDYRFPPAVVADVVRTHWHGDAVRQHLLHAFAPVVSGDASGSGESSGSGSGNTCEPTQFICAVEAVERLHTPPEAVSLARIAPSYFPLSFLATGSGSGKDANNKTVIQDEEAALQYVAHRCRNSSSSREDGSEEKEEPLDTTKGIRGAYPELLRRGAAGLVLEACALFTPLSMFRYVAAFFVAVAQRRHGDAGAALAAALEAFLAVPAGTAAEAEAAWCVDALVAECERVCARAVAAGARHFLARFFGVLARSGVLVHPRCSARLCAMQANFCAVGGDARVPLALIAEEPRALVADLLARRNFVLALAVAQQCGLDCSAVYFAQADSMVDVHRAQECVWSDERARVALWNRISRLFLTNRVEPLRAGAFFFARAHDADADRARAAPTFIPSRERLELLRIAFYWYAGKPAKYAPLQWEQQQRPQPQENKGVPASTATATAAAASASASVWRGVQSITKIPRRSMYWLWLRVLWSTM